MAGSMTGPGKPTFFKTPAAWRTWLEKHHATESELWVGFYRVGSGKPSITWPESVDAALCFGWIDGVRKSLDELSYVIRFTPKRAGSIWSLVNIKRVAELTRLGLMAERGLAAFARRQDDRSAIYSYEQRRNARLPAAYQKEMKARPDAWSFFQAQPPGYRRTITHWIVSAKRPETQLRRLRQLIDACAAGRRIEAIARPDARRPVSRS
jgi:uncharacterized protein YdeI (YjbR/CyaY-like superfamily)